MHGNRCYSEAHFLWLKGCEAWGTHVHGFSAGNRALSLRQRASAAKDPDEAGEFVAVGHQHLTESYRVYVICVFLLNVKCCLLCIFRDAKDPLDFLCRLFFGCKKGLCVFQPCSYATERELFVGLWSETGRAAATRYLVGTVCSYLFSELWWGNRLLTKNSMQGLSRTTRVA